MSANHAKHFDTRKASAEETARWILPEVQRAEGRGFDEVSIKVRDMKELLSYIEAVSYRARVEFSGKRLGYANPQAMRDLLSRKVDKIEVHAIQSEQACTLASYTDLPPKGVGDE